MKRLWIAYGLDWGAAILGCGCTRTGRREPSWVGLGTRRGARHGEPIGLSFYFIARLR
jgi:hypothetical protein